jgi:restriction endonuclease
LQRALNTDKPDELVFDISMETGTSKTYAYTKAMFDLAKFCITHSSLSTVALLHKGFLV